MEVRALCIRLMMKVLFLLAAHDEVGCSVIDNDAFPKVVPNRQQFFEYEPIIFDCEGLMGLTGWRVLKKIKGETHPCANTWALSISPCKIDNAISKVDTGEYWCKNGLKQSSSVYIEITGGPVILESPVHPVDEGVNVTLTCRNKESSPNITAEFFKDGVLMDSSPTGTMTINSVSRSEEGLYKCRISGEGESPQSWLTVREVQDVSASDPVPLLVWTCLGVCVFLVVLVLLVGFSRHRKHPAVLTEDSPLSVQAPPPTQTVSEEISTNAPTQTMYGFVDKPKKKRASEEVCMENSMQSTYALISKSKKKTAPKETCIDDSALQTTYSFIDTPKKKKASEEVFLDIPTQSTYALINKPTKKTGPHVSSRGPVPSTGTNLLLKEEDHRYYTID